MKNSTKIIIMIILLVVVGGSGFFAGVKYQQTKQPQPFAQGRQFGRGQFQNGMGTRPIRGEIISSDDKSITVKMQDGSSKIVIPSTNTVINKAAQGTKDDLKNGETLMVFGTQNSDGSITAQNIQLNPQNRLPSVIPTPK